MSSILRCSVLACLVVLMCVPVVLMCPPAVLGQTAATLLADLDEDGQQVLELR